MKEKEEERAHLGLFRRRLHLVVEEREGEPAEERRRRQAVAVDRCRVSEGLEEGMASGERERVDVPEGDDEVVARDAVRVVRRRRERDREVAERDVEQVLRGRDEA